MAPPTTATEAHSSALGSALRRDRTRLATSTKDATGIAKFTHHTKGASTLKRFAQPIEKIKLVDAFINENPTFAKAAPAVNQNHGVCRVGSQGLALVRR